MGEVCGEDGAGMSRPRRWTRRCPPAAPNGPAQRDYEPEEAPDRDGRDRRRSERLAANEARTDQVEEVGKRENLEIASRNAGISSVEKKTPERKAVGR